jgi:DNA-binding NarL/FixJ family response regulator
MVRAGPAALDRAQPTGSPIPMQARHETSPVPSGPVVRVLTVDDQERFRDVAREVIDASPGFELVGEAVSGDEALTSVSRLAPHLVLLDVRLRGMGGVEVARRLIATHADVLVVLLSIDEPIDIPSAARLNGSVTVVRKQDFSPRLLWRLWAEYRG